MNQLTLFPIDGLPLVQPGDDIGQLIVDGLIQAQLADGDIIFIAQKIVSKAEDRFVNLKDVVPDERAHEVAAKTAKDPRFVQVVLDDSKSIIRAFPGLMITEHNSGWISANSGADRSNVSPENVAMNVDHDDENQRVLLLPENADASAERIRQRIHELTGVTVAVIISDSHGRPWRMGNVGVCIGCAGLPPIWDQRGLHDLYGYELVGSEECIADELAAAAGLLMGQSAEGRPVVVIRGYQWPSHLPPQPAKTIQRPAEMDAFR
ncbi:MAG: coenzyme F420-0:L-glutamate ligase [Chloroflexota bacterium]